MTIATLAGSIATSSIPSLLILNLASVTRSEITEMLSLSSVGSASVSFMCISPLENFVSWCFISFIILQLQKYSLPIRHWVECFVHFVPHFCR